MKLTQLKKLTSYCLTVGLGLTLFSTASSSALQIKETKWNDGDQKLVIKGKGADRRAIVTFSSAGSGTIIGETRASRGGEFEVKFRRPDVVPCEVTATAGDQSTTRSVEKAPDDCDGANNPPPPPPDDGGDPPTLSGKYAILAANDLGMHCADQDYRIFSILPPYNVINAQVIEKGASPKILSNEDGVEVTYYAIPSNIVDPNQPDLPPIATDSVNSTSENAPGVFKSNFWEPGGYDSHGFLTYFPLYPSEPSNPEFGLLGLFPYEVDLGLPAPDVVSIYLGADGIPLNGDEALAAHQATMPSAISDDPLVTWPYNANEPQKFHGYVDTLPFFINLPMGYLVENFKRFTAEGIPILPVDDQGRENAYPLYRVEARDKATHEVLAEVDVVLPVASEADCQQCHASQDVCDTATQYTLVCDDVANTMDGVNFIDYDSATGQYSEPVPGDNAEQQILNAAKINILRLHDKKHSDNGILEDDLDHKRHVVCASCHYSPALDLAHLGPNDDNGKEQTQHISMSRAMHASHGNLNKLDQFSHLFPDMPPPNERTPEEQDEILQAACYNCHPGKRTKCLRGAMGGGGITCQDCHGQMAQVGNDFTENFPTDGSLDLTKRVPWANEPMCQSCHVGDVLQVAQLQSIGALDDVSFNAADNKGHADGLRLNMAYTLSDHAVNGGSDNLALLNFSESRFASNKPLYRLSGGDDGSDKGHGGLSCEGCHGSTHAIWPNANPFANDNATSTSVQGHSGTIIECSVCHEGSLGLTLGGPHGMHPINDPYWTDKHEELAEHNKDACRACHGQNGEGTVLSRAVTSRVVEVEDKLIQLNKGDPVGCGTCHENEL